MRGSPHGFRGPRQNVGYRLMSSFDWEKQNRRKRLLNQGSEALEPPKPPKDDMPTRKSDLVKGVYKAAMAANRMDRENLQRLKNRLNKWLNAGDVSPIEIDKLQRSVRQLEAKLLPERLLNAKKRKERMIKRKGRPRNGNPP